MNKCCSQAKLASEKSRNTTCKHGYCMDSLSEHFYPDCKSADASGTTLPAHPMKNHRFTSDCTAKLKSCGPSPFGLIANNNNLTPVMTRVVPTSRVEKLHRYISHHNQAVMDPGYRTLEVRARRRQGIEVQGLVGHGCFGLRRRLNCKQ